MRTLRIAEAALAGAAAPSIRKCTFGFYSDGADHEFNSNEVGAAAAATLRVLTVFYGEDNSATSGRAGEQAKESMSE